MIEKQGSRDAVVVKICGLKTPEALDAALEAGADMSASCSFRRRRAISASRPARALGARVRGRRQKVALSVDADDALAGGERRGARARHAAAARQGNAGARGRRSGRFGLPVMKAMPVETRADLAADPALRRGRRPAAVRCARAARATRPGGLGKSFDWRLLAGSSIPACRSCSRAGSTPAMSPRRCASRARRAASTFSGVERAPGEKDLREDPRFVRAARAAGVAAVRRRPSEGRRARA